MSQSALRTLPGARREVRRASRSHTMSGLARFGLAARAFVYLVIGWLAVQIALGHHTQQANQRGALAEVAQNTVGLVLLWLIAFGFGAYALWRLSEAAFGTAAEGSKAGPRIQSGVRGLVYAGLCVSAFSFIAGTSHSSQSKQQATLTARVMRHDLGRWLVGLVGAVVVIVAIVLIVEGVTRKFETELRMGDMSPAQRRVVSVLGAVGTVARGVVFGVAGGLVVSAAVNFDPAQSTGLDGAVRTLADQPYGPALLGVLAFGLISFGVYGFAAARWAKT
jgi:hypothetical protein